MAAKFCSVAQRVLTARAELIGVNRPPALRAEVIGGGAPITAVGAGGSIGWQGSRRPIGRGSRAVRCLAQYDEARARPDRQS